MAHRTTHRRNLAVGDPKTSLDPTRKSHPHPHPDPSPTSTPSTTSAAANKPHHPTASSTVRNISNRFSKLYANHKPFASLKPSNPPSHPRVYTNLQAKALTKSAIDDSSLLKSNLQYRGNIEEMKESVRVKATVIDGKEKKFSRVSHGGHDVKTVSLPAKTEDVNKFSKKEREKKEFHEGRDIKRSSNSLARSQDSGLKEYLEGYDMKRPSVSLSISGGRRRSFCSSQIELSDFFSCTGVKVVSVDMPPFMQVHAVDCARKAHDSLEKFTHKSLALTLKKEFDGVYGPAWHCIVGTSFGSFVTHSVGGFLYFSMDHKLYVLLFKTTVQRAD